jgi:hypothetical protein
MRMTRTRLMLFGAAAGVLVGCAAPADPPPSGGVASNTPAVSEPKVITSGDTGAVGGPAIMTPGPASPQDGTAMSEFTSTPVSGLPQCNQYSATATINGKPQPLKGEACQQPDGSWHIAEQPAGSSVVYQTVYWPPAGAVAYDACFGNPYDYPCLYNFPFGASIGVPVFIDIHHHFHHFGPIGHFGPIDHFAHVGGFHDGFHGGFAGGFQGGFPGGGFHHR